jgi:hypothetical protein
MPWGDGSGDALGDALGGALGDALGMLGWVGRAGLGDALGEWGGALGDALGVLWEMPWGMSRGRSDPIRTKKNAFRLREMTFYL